MIYAEPNLNGNSKEDFAKATVQLDFALLQLRRALGNVRANVLHGRNYQHLSESGTCREHDDLKVLHAHACLDKFENLARDIEAKAVA